MPSRKLVAEECLTGLLREMERPPPPPDSRQRVSMRWTDDHLLHEMREDQAKAPKPQPLERTQHVPLAIAPGPAIMERIKEVPSERIKEVPRAEACRTGAHMERREARSAERRVESRSADAAVPEARMEVRQNLPGTYQQCPARSSLPGIYDEPRQRSPSRKRSLSVLAKRRRKRKRSRSSSSSSSSSSKATKVQEIVKRKKRELEEQQRNQTDSYVNVQAEFGAREFFDRRSKTDLPRRVQAYERHLMLNEAREQQWHHERGNEKEQARLRLIAKEVEKEAKKKQKEKEKKMAKARQDKEEENEEDDRQKKIAQRLAARRELKSRDALAEMIKEAKEVTPAQHEAKKGKGQDSSNKNVEDTAIKTKMIKHLSLEHDDGKASIDDALASQDKVTQGDGGAILLEDDDDDQDVPVLATSDAYM